MEFLEILEKVNQKKKKRKWRVKKREEGRKGGRQRETQLSNWSISLRGTRLVSPKGTDKQTRYLESFHEKSLWFKLGELWLSPLQKSNGGLNLTINSTFLVSASFSQSLQLLAAFYLMAWLNGVVSKLGCTDPGGELTEKVLDLSILSTKPHNQTAPCPGAGKVPALSPTSGKPGIGEGTFTDWRGHPINQWWTREEFQIILAQWVHN